MNATQQRQSDETNIAVMASNVSDIKDAVKEIKGRLDNNYVTKEAFEPIRRGFYGIVGIIVTVAIYAIMAGILKK